MTNNQLALDFAREVMGWGDDAENGAGILEYEPWGIITTVQRWCDEHDAVLDINYYDYAWTAKIPLKDDTQVIQQSLACCDEDLTTALMSACLAAERKRIGVKGGEVV